MALYFLSDICFMDDVFSAFRKNYLDEYQLDPAYFVSGPQLAWRELIKHIIRLISLMTDSEMYRIILSNIFGDICDKSVHYARANNKLMNSLYDPQQPTSYIIEVDANNLDGWGMSQKMPDGDFEWLSQNECHEMGQLLNYENGRFAISILNYSNIRGTRKTKQKFYSRFGLKVPAGAARARRRLFASSGNIDDRA